ncbi:MAG: arylsulfatase [Fuerstiella sp.]
MKRGEQDNQVLVVSRRKKVALQFVVAMVVTLMVQAAESLAAESSPNVIVILTDDQGWGDLSFHGNDNLATPHIDKLAKTGVSFDRFYVCPVCSPTRAEFLTGRYHGRCGVYSTSAGGERLNLGERTIAEHFKDNGYRTGCYGKWHNGTQFPYHPMARGFDEYYGFCSGHWGHYYSPLIDKNGTISRGNGFLPDDLTDQVVSEILESNEKPFFIYLAFNTPHSPMQVPDRWWKKFEDKKLGLVGRKTGKESRQHTRAALAMCENVDWNVGRIVEALEKSNQRDNTLIAYFSDNGPNGDRWNGGMKGRKGSTDEGGVRSPLFLNWPNHFEVGRQVGSNAAAIDLFPTLASLSGVPVKSGHPFDGEDLSAKILGDADQQPDERVIISQWKNKISAKSGVYRMDQRGDVYDLSIDPEQRKSVKPPGEVQRRMTAALKKYESEVSSSYGQDDRPFLIGHPDHAMTQMPIRDASLIGGLKRSNKFPNSSYATQWSSSEDQIQWDVEVAEGGLFEVTIYYTVRPEDVGSAVRLTFGEEVLSAVVAAGRVPDEVGRVEDRYPRVESYEQSWGQQSLGSIYLTQEAGRLILTAPQIAGEEVMDLRLMTLTRQIEDQKNESVNRGQ